MTDRYAALISQELGRLSAPDGAARKQVYGRIFTALTRAYAKLPDGRDNPEFLSISLAFSDAITAAERNYEGASEPETSRFEHMETVHPRNAMVTQYILFAGVLGAVADVLQPVMQLTVPMAIGSLSVASVLVILRRVRGDTLGHLRRVSQFCMVLFASCLLWFGAQQLVPQAQASGAVAQIVPGVSEFQQAILHRLTGIEGQTARIGDILEQQAEAARQAQERERQAYLAGQREYEHAQRIDNEARIKRAGDRVAAGGYSADTAGMLKAANENFSYIDDFALLGITLQASDLAAALNAEMDEGALYSLRSFVRNHARDDIEMQVLQQNLEREYRRLSDFTHSRSSAGSYRSVPPPHVRPAIKNDVCDKEKYSVIVSESALDELCEMPISEFFGSQQSYISRYL